MNTTNRQSGTNVHEVAEGIYRINTPIAIPGGGGFSFNQYLIVDDEPLLFHAGLRGMFPLIREAVATILPVEKLGYITLSHTEADEAGALNDGKPSGIADLTASPVSGAFPHRRL